MAYFLGYDCTCSRVNVPKHNLRAFFTVKCLCDISYAFIYMYVAYSKTLIACVAGDMCQGITCGICYDITSFCGRFKAYLNL